MNGSNEKNGKMLRLAVLLGMVLLAAALRVLPHPWNFAPVGAMALFSGAMFRNRWLAFAAPLLALFAGDLFIGFYKVMFAVYLSFALSVAIGRWLAENRSVLRIGGAVLLGALQFFLVSNFAMWAFSDYYPHTRAGLFTCFVAAVPYFWNTLAGDVLYSAVLFGGFALAERMAPALQAREPHSAASISRTAR